jgi:putative transposase
MVAGSFCVGQRLFIKNDVHRVTRDLGNGVVALEQLASGRIKEQRIEDLLRLWASGDLCIGERPDTTPKLSELHRAIDQAHLDAFRQSYTDEQQERAKAKLVFVERLKKLPRSAPIMTPVIHETWGDKALWENTWSFPKPPHFTSVANWIRVYERSGSDLRALVNRDADKGSKGARTDGVVNDIVDDLIQTRYLTEERPTIKTIHKEAKGLVALRNTTRLPSQRLKAPCYASIKRRVHEIPPYDRCRARFGQRIADLKFRVAGQGVVAAAPLTRAAMDHSRMDVFVVDERSRLPLGRPWLTLVIDEYSRYVLGYYISFEEPSAVSMTRAMRHALSPKVLFDEVQGKWDAWGIMALLIIDNGMEFHSKALESGIGRYGISVQFCPRRKPWFKGKVERFFGTMNTGLLVDIKGKTFSNFVLKGDYDPAKHAVLTLATLRRVVEMWIVDVYHKEIHRGLGMSPEQAWQEGLNRVDRYLPPSSILLDSAFSSSSTRLLSHKGIEFDLLFYNSRELGVLREQYGSELTVEIRAHDDDLGSLIVVAPDGKTLIKVPAVDVEYASGLTRWQHKVCKRFQRATLEDDARDISLLEARNRIRSLIEQDMKLSPRKTRNQQQRFLGKETSSDVNSTLSQPNAELSVNSTTTANLDTATVGNVMPAVAQVRAADNDHDDIPELPSRKVASRGEVK